ncbi:MAG: DUF438 domain-containing protein [Candidatus Hodarchaeales archaeon]|jgi:DUF438 domain-containing protein
MTEGLGKRDERREQLKALIRELHKGAAVEDVKNRFKDVIQDVGSSELASIENELINEGMPESEVKRLCDVHVAVFKETLGDQRPPDLIPGHPVHVLMEENRALEKIVDEIKELLEKVKQNPNDELLFEWKEKHNLLWDIDKHYLRKENLLFPILERHDFYGPSKVMWALHDDIRDELKKITTMLDEGIAAVTVEKIDEIVLPALKMITEMIFKEENILLPTSIEKLSIDEWIGIAQESDEIGYCMVPPEKDWILKTIGETAHRSISGNLIKLPTGNITLEQLELLFNNLPVDITFVDEEDQVIYFTEGERIFIRTKAIIGRKVHNCHPPKSYDVVDRILKEFKSNKRDMAEFWIDNFKGKFIYIRFFAIRDSGGKYRGTIEVAQDVTGIRKLQGEKRILDPL